METSSPETSPHVRPVSTATSASAATPASVSIPAEPVAGTPTSPASVREGTRVAVRVVDVIVLTSAPGGCFPDRWRVLTLRRAAGTRCTGAWEIVHGRIEDGERPAEAACREVWEETGLRVDRLYSITVNPFYLSPSDTVQLAVVYAAVVNTAEPAVLPAIHLSEEHDAARWCNSDEALQTLAWPREQEALRHAMWLLRTGNAGPVEDVLLVATSASPPRANAPAPARAPHAAAPAPSR